ncbi:hypothetical protein GUJ93_ZPchr0006g43014 [Zizania palustris]|uniref:Uncharacterized protein n=1 Tax=Zizania palustris TaxID=103762 RepID=A0A8J5S8B3_ZIZPA|nr:hypothetical protein GUJ93_ZPchr0006g43014 [Zizania palustris]
MSVGGDGERDCRSGLRTEAGLERGAAADGRLVEDRARIDRPPNQLADNGDRPSRGSVRRAKEGSRRLPARATFSGIYWLRFWTQLQHDDTTKELMRQTRSLLEIIALDIANLG